MAPRVSPPLALLPAWTTRAGVSSNAVLDALFARAAENGDDGADDRWLLGVVAAPLHAEDGSRVFGQAAVGGGCAVVSFPARDAATDCDAIRSMDRAVKTAVHELAHAAGLGHCADPACVMYPSRDIDDTDRKAAGFCAACGELFAHATLDGVRR